MSYNAEARAGFNSPAARVSQTRSLQPMRVAHHALRELGTSDELFAVLRDPAAEFDRKDQILIALLVEHEVTPRGGALDLLTVAMLPMLDTIYANRVGRAGSGDRDDLWSGIQAAFTEAVDHYPISRRPRKVAANLRGETLAALRHERKSEIAEENLRAEIAGEILPILAAAMRLDVEPEPFALFGSWRSAGTDARATEPPDFESAEHTLDEYLASGTIDVGDRFLILGWHLYGRPLEELAAELCVRRETAKKRLHRALVRIRKGSGPGGRKLGARASAEESEVPPVCLSPLFSQPTFTYGRRASHRRKPTGAAGGAVA